MLQQLLPAFKATLVLALLTGLVFPLLITGLAQMLFSDEANGKLIRSSQGTVIGSSLIGQQFTRPEYFHPRPSAAGSGYSGEASGGTNLGPTSSKLILGKEDDKATPADESFAGVKQLAQNFAAENFLGPAEKVPVDAVTRSGSGLDPHISSANARMQARRVAKTRSLPLTDVVEIIDKNTEPRTFGLLGEPGVNVLKANLALDKASPKMTQKAEK